MTGRLVRVRTVWRGAATSRAAGLLVAALAALAPACVPSLSPLVDDARALFEPALVGTWVSEGSGWRRLAEGEAPGAGDERWVVTRSGPSTYAVEMIAEDTHEHLDMRCGRFGPGLFIELAGREEDDDFIGMHHLPARTFYRVDLAGDRAVTRALDGHWLEDALREGRVRLPHAHPDGRLVLTATTAQLQRFVERHGTEPGAFGPSPDGLIGRAEARPTTRPGARLGR